MGRLKDERPPLFLDGIKVGNSPTDYRAIHNLQITRFDDTNWIPIGDMIDLDGIAS
jgi:branched-chain amino acid transport system substrate-binding protein